MAAGRRILLAYLVYFTALGAAFPYLPVFYRDLGLGLAEIGVLTAIQAAVQLVLAPVWGGLADRFPRTRLTLPLAAVVATIGAVVLFRATDFAVVLAGSIVLYGGMAGIGPTLDARTLETLGTARRNRYGEVRAFGSLAFVLATLAVGFLLDAEGARALFWVYIPFLIGTIVVTATIPRRGATRSTNILCGTTQFLAGGEVALFFGGVVVVWAALAALNAFYSIQIVALGGSAGLVGIAWSIGAFIEVPYMYVFPRVAKRFRTERLVVAGSVAFAIRAPPGRVRHRPGGARRARPARRVSASPASSSAGVTVVAERAPAGLQGTAQGLFAASTGLATIIGSLVGGLVAGALGIGGLFAVCGVVGLGGDARSWPSRCCGRTPRRTGVSAAS